MTKEEGKLLEIWAYGKTDTDVVLPPCHPPPKLSYSGVIMPSEDLLHEWGIVNIYFSAFSHLLRFIWVLQARREVGQKSEFPDMETEAQRG